MRFKLLLWDSLRFPLSPWQAKCLSCLARFQSRSNYDSEMYRGVLYRAICITARIVSWGGCRYPARAYHAVIAHQTVSWRKAHVFALLSHLFNSLCQHQAYASFHTDSQVYPSLLSLFLSSHPQIAVQSISVSCPHNSFLSRCDCWLSLLLCAGL